MRLFQSLSAALTLAAFVAPMTAADMAVAQSGPPTSGWSAPGAASPFARQTCQGSLLLGYFSLLAAQKLPGFGAILCKSEADFEKPVYLGDKMTFWVAVAQKREHRKLILEAKAVNQWGIRCISGSLIIKTLD